jgi:predicted GIY-YIG superfamily endonuclease
MYYAYILKSEVAEEFYYGSTANLKTRLQAHNAGQNISTKKYRPWGLVWYAAFVDRVTAEAFEKYLKTASGKAFLRKRLIVSGKRKSV